MGWETIIFNYIDLIWVPVALVALHKGHRLLGALFAASCSFVMRLQIELMQAIGHGNGFFHWMHTGLYLRGLITYGVFILLFFMLAHFSPRTDRFVFVAASITIFILAFCVSSAIMVL